MRKIWISCLIIVLSLFLLYAKSTNFGEPIKLLGDFSKDWRSKWNERKFTRRRTIYQVVEDEGKQVLMGWSDTSASGLWRLLQLHPGSYGRISWRWKVVKGIAGNRLERTRKGDDYAARVFVVFEPHFLSWKTRAICYVWASSEPPGSIYPSAYAKNVATIVLETGSQRIGTWIAESRDFVADYKRYFKSPPKTVSAVAIMIDTDNTGTQAAAKFDDIVLNAAP